MSEQVEVEVIKIPSPRERRISFLADSARSANEIARERNAKTKANREKYARPKK